MSVETLSPEIKKELPLEQRLEEAELSYRAKKEGRKLLDYYEQLKKEKERLSDKRKIRDNLRKQKETLENILSILGGEEPEIIDEEAIITAKNPEGQEVKIDLEEERDYWLEFYKKNNLDLEDFPEKFELNEEQREKIKKLIKEKYYDMLVYVDPRIKASEMAGELGKGYNPLDPTDNRISLRRELRDVDGFTTVDSDTGTERRPQKPYLIFTRTSDEPESLGNSPHLAETVFRGHGLSGLSLQEYLLFQRRYYEKTNDHPDKKSRTFLSSSMFGDEVLAIDWKDGINNFLISNVRRSTDRNDWGTRSGAIFELE